MLGARTLKANMATDDDDSKELQEAIEESMKGHSPDEKTQPSAPAPAGSKEEDQRPARRINIDDRIKEMTLQPALELPKINDPAGDTWLFIDPPSKQPEQDDIEYTRYSKHYQTPIVVKKETLLKYHETNTNEGFSFEPLFGPSAQFRIIRRRKLTSQLRDEPRIKYVIDLTPPTEGEDAVFLTTELCCSHGVRLWFQAGDIWSVSKILVGGREEYVSGEKQSFSRTDETERIESVYDSDYPSKWENTPFNTHTPNTGKKVADDKHDISSASTPTLMPLEYSPIRHRSAIERVIGTLLGIDPKLDSAPKVWTTFAVANYLGLKNSPVTDYIIRWLRAYPNSFFLEVCPEVSLRIADGLQSHDLARDTFAILVGEEALDSFCRARTPGKNRQYSVYGRRKEDLPEKIFSRIEYASKSLQERIRGDFEDLAGDKMKWIEQLPEFQRLVSNEHPNLQDTVNALVVLLKDYVRGTIYKVLCADYDHVPPPSFHNPGGTELIQRVSRSVVWSNLSTDERILSRTFWLALVSSTLFSGSNNLKVPSGWGQKTDHVTQNLKELREQSLGTYRKVARKDLVNVIAKGNRLVAEQGQRLKCTLPDRTRIQPNHSRPVLPVSNFPSEDLYSKAREPVNPLYDAQISSKEDPVQYTKPTAPIDIIKPVSKADLPELARISQPRETCSDEDQEIWASKAVQSEDQPPEGSALSWWSDQDEEEIENGGDNQSHDIWSQDGRSTPPFFREPQEPPFFRKPQEGVDVDKGWNRLSTPANIGFFNLTEFFVQARESINATARRKLSCADSSIRDEPYEIGITNTLVCLEDTEWKYLPLWAGGYDDDTGGVFDEQLPAPDLGFSTCGPEVHTGITPANSDGSSSEFDMFGSDFGANTTSTSMINNRSFAEAHRKHVYAADSMDSTSSDDFDVVTPYEDSVEENAREQTEAQERLEVEEEEAVREARRFESRMVEPIDENYADLFNDDDDDDDTSTDCADDSDTQMGDDVDNEDLVML